MMRRAAIVAAMLGLVACATTTSEKGTLAELDNRQADLTEVLVADSLERAAESYRRYLEETPQSARTPEAMRRLADLQIEQAYGVMGSGDIVEMVAPEAASTARQISTAEAGKAAAVSGESDLAFEQRATEREQLLARPADFDAALPDGGELDLPAGPKEAIDTYWSILEQYPNYERNDQVLYQLSRAYDEIGEPDNAMEVMDRLVAEYPFSKYLDEIHFRRGEYFFVRRQFLDAEYAYAAAVRIGPSSSYYELALYKLGWAFYKQELYEEALHNYIAMLDHRLTIGFDFDQEYDEDDEHRLTDTLRVVSLSFSNLGGPEVLDEYFRTNGHRTYADKIYGNLAEFYFGKLRYEDSASVYKSFIALNPYHRVAPQFGMRVVEIYADAGFPRLVVEAKKDFATTYAIGADYWDYFDIAERPEIVGFLKLNLTDLAGHYHALYQEETLEDERPANFSEANRWYRQYLASFSGEAATAKINYQLADLLLENEDFGDAATEYERTAYDYEPHEKSAAAGYAAVFSHREHLKAATGSRQLDVKQATVASSLRFADAFPDHEQAPVVLGKAADDLYDMTDLQPAIDAATKLIARYPEADRPLLRSAWAVVAHSSLDLTEYVDAEHAYSNVLELTDADDETRAAIVDGLAASIYKQGEQANLLEDYRAAAGHFLRIKDVAPTSSIRTSAEYDAAAALMTLEDWTMAANVLEEFRVTHPEHDLRTEATKQLAHIYRVDGQTTRSAAEHERISAEADDPELSREALLSAAELYDEASATDDAVRVYEQYVADYPQPLDVNVEARQRLAEIHKDQLDYKRYHDQLGEIVLADRLAGEHRTDRSRFLAATAALVLAELTYGHFAELALTQPFEESLAEKQRRMDVAMEAFENLTAYQVADVTAAATFYIAEIFFDFSAALMNSERPDGLSDAEKLDYELVIEEEAYPFEERAIEVHEANFELLAGGVYNEWVQQSLDKLGDLMPGRYAKNEISGGYLGSLESYAYRMPIVPPAGIESAESAEELQSDEQPQSAPLEIAPRDDVAENTIAGLETTF